MDEAKVKDVFPMQAGIMQAISDLGGYGFNPDMDLLLLSKCGNRLITPVVEMLLDGADRLTQAHIERLAALIMFEYGEPWKRIKEALMLEYNPLSASQYHEEETTDIAGESSDNDSTEHKTDVSAANTPTGPGNYIPDGQESTETQSSNKSKSNTTRTLDRTSNSTSFKSADLLQSEIAMRVNSRFTAQVLEDVKNYIAMMIY